MKKRITSILLLLSMLVCMLPAGLFTVQAAGVDWADDGSGTEDDPYTIGSLQTMKKFVDEANNRLENTKFEVFKDVYFKLTADIGSKGNYLGTAIKKFEGHFDGDGHTIFVNDTLFKILGQNAVVSNLTIDGNCFPVEGNQEDLVPYLTAEAQLLLSKDTLGLVVENLSEAEYPIACFCILNIGVIENCKSNVEVTISQDYDEDCAGFCSINFGTLYGCENSGAFVSSKELSGCSGICHGNVGLINYCTNSGDFKLVNDNTAEWFVRINECTGICSMNEGTIINSKNTGDFIIDAFQQIDSIYSKSIEGCSGICYDNVGYIFNCLNAGDFGGQDIQIEECGGLIYTNVGTIKNCINCASFTAAECKYIGGLGYSALEFPGITNLVDNCFYIKRDAYSGAFDEDVDISYTAYELSEGQAKATSIYEGFDAVEGGLSAVVLLNNYIDRNKAETGEWIHWKNGEDGYPVFKEPATIVTIKSLDGLESLAQEINAGNQDTSGVVYSLGADIDGLTTPIGNAEHPFNGEFLGNGHTVTLAMTSASSYSGLFGCIGESGSVINVQTAGTVTGMSGVFYIGGLCGYNEGVVSNCLSSAAVSGTGASYIGGFCGYNKGTMKNCASVTTVTADSSENVGGFCGIDGGSIVSCYYDSASSGSAIGTGLSHDTIVGEGNTDGVLLLLLNGYEDETGAYPASFTRWAKNSETAPFLAPVEVTFDFDDVFGSVSLNPVDVANHPYNCFAPGETVMLNVETAVGCSLKQIDPEGTVFNVGNVYTLRVPDTSVTVTFDFADNNPGTGTEDDPYIIRSLKQLEKLAQEVNNGNSYKGKYFRLAADIGSMDGERVVSGLTTPIGTSRSPFRGCFDGAGHTVVLNMTKETSVPIVAAMFGCIWGEDVVVTNVITDGIVDAIRSAGVCVYSVQFATISNCVNNASIGSSAVGGAGICLRCNGTIIGCVNNGMIGASSADPDDPKLIGSGAGICQQLYKSASIINCVNNGDIFGINVSGIVLSCGGDNRDQDDFEDYEDIVPGPSILKGCVNNGDIYGEYIAGLSLEGDCNISDCMNFGDMTATRSAVGLAENATLTNCLCSSNIESVDYVVALAIDSIASNCLFVGSITCENPENVALFVSSNVDGAYYNTESELKNGLPEYHSEHYDSGYNNINKVSDEALIAASGASGALIDILNKYVGDGLTWVKEPDGAPHLPYYVNCIGCDGVTVVAVPSYGKKDETIKLNVHIDSAVDACGLTFSDSKGTITSAIFNDGGEYSFTMPNDFVFVRASSFICTDEDNVIIAKRQDGLTLTLTLTNTGMISEQEKEVWENGGLSVPDVLFEYIDALDAYRASISVGKAKATTLVNPDLVKPHSIIVFSGTAKVGDGNGASYLKEVMPGETVTLNIGYYPTLQFSEWSGNVTVSGSKKQTVSFIMPNEDVIVEAVFANCYNVAVFDGQTVKSELHTAGKEVTVNKGETPNNMKFQGWSTVDVNIAGQEMNEAVSFIMPEHSVLLTAKFSVLNSVTVYNGKVLYPSDAVIAGELVIIEAILGEYEVFSGWTSESGVTFSDPTAKMTSFIMPDNDVIITALTDSLAAKIPTESSKIYVYDGNPITYLFDDPGDSNLYTLEGSSRTNAGTYTVTAKLIDGVKWEDDTTGNKTFTFTILPKQIIKPVSYPADYYYCGKEEEFFLCVKYDDDYYFYSSFVSPSAYTVTGEKRTDAGEQTVTVTPTANYCWEDGTQESETFTFTIKPLPIPYPMSDPHTFTYNESEQKYTPYIILGDAAYDCDGVFYNLTNRKQTEVGKYIVTATPAKNFCWEENESLDPCKFTFEIKERKLNSYIYYLQNLDAGGILTPYVDLSFTAFDRNNPSISDPKLKDHYKPFLANAPAGANVTYYITDKDYGNEYELVRHATLWDEVYLNQLKPQTTYIVFAVVTCDGYEDAQITDITECSRFVTSQQYMLNFTTKSTEIKREGLSTTETIEQIFDGGLTGWALTKHAQPYEKVTSITCLKYKSYSNFAAAVSFGIDCINVKDADTLNVTITWNENGSEQSTMINGFNLPNVINDYNSGKFRNNPAKMNSVALKMANADDPQYKRIKNVTGMPEPISLKLAEAVSLGRISELELSNSEYLIPLAEEEKDLFSEELLNCLEIVPAKQAGYTDDEGTYHPFSPYFNVSVDTLLYNPANTESMLYWDEENSAEYTLSAASKLNGSAVSEIDDYTFVGLYYKAVTADEKQGKASVNNDNGLILTQDLTKWDLETDIVTRDTELVAVYLKNGTSEAIDYNVDVKLQPYAGRTATVTLPKLVDGMHYGEIISNNGEYFTIDTTNIENGKLTLTALKPYETLTEREPLTFTVKVEFDDISKSLYFYNILVSVTPFEWIEGDRTNLSLTSGTWAVSGEFTFENPLEIDGDVTIFLADNSCLTATHGIHLTTGNKLTIIAESNGKNMGKLVATGDYGVAGIGGGFGENSGTLIINGGNIEATGGIGAAGIGGGFNGSGETVTINGGIITAKAGVGAISGEGGAGIGGGYNGKVGTVEINDVQKLVAKGGRALGAGLKAENIPGNITVAQNLIVTSGQSPETPLVAIGDETEIVIVSIKYTGVSLTLDSDIYMNFYMKLPEDAKENGTMHFTIGKRTVEADIKTNTNGTYFTCPVTSLEMATDVLATFTYLGKKCECTYSVAKYIGAILNGMDQDNNPYSDEAKLLARKIANYGHYAQIYLESIHTNVKIGENGYAEMFKCDDVDINAAKAIETLKDYKITVTGTSDSLELYGSTVYFDSATALNYYVTVTDEKVPTATAVNTVTGEAKQVEIKLYKDNIYIVSVKDITATELTDNIEATINDELTITGSVFAYCNSVVSAHSGDTDGKTDEEKAKDEKAVNAMAAFCEYYEAACDYAKKRG